MKTPIFKGSCVAIITPFGKDGRINYEVFGKLIDFNIANGTNAITVCGTTGEASTLSDDEHRDLIEFCVKHTAGRVPVIAGTGSNDTAYALELSLFAQSAGADGVLLINPYYNKTSPHGLVKHFEYILDRLNLPAILYNVPSRTGMSFSAGNYYELSKHPLVNGIKEASGNFTLIAQTAALCGENVNIYSGNDGEVVPILSLGGKGVISVAANIIPKVMSDICRLWFEGKPIESSALMIRYFDFLNTLFCEVNPVPIKTVMNLCGFDAGPLRMPLFDMCEKNLNILKTSMKGVSLLP